jgi:phosphoglycolate phosphatase
MESLGRPLPPDHDYGANIGPPIRAVLTSLCGDDEGLQARALAAYRERFAEVGLFENRVYPGIEPMLKRLGASFRLYVCTSKPAVYATRIVEHFGLNPFFAGVYGCELDGTRGSKGELIRWLLERENIAPERALMIGDRSHDVLGAAENGVPAAAVLWGYGSEDELRGAGCRLTFARPDDLTVEALRRGMCL